MNHFRDISHISYKDRKQLPALLLQYFGQTAIEKFMDDMLDQGVIEHHKHYALQKVFYLREPGAKKTAYIRKPVKAPPPPPPKPTKPRLRIPTVARRVGPVKEPIQAVEKEPIQSTIRPSSIRRVSAKKIKPVKRSWIWKLRNKLSKFLQP